MRISIFILTITLVFPIISVSQTKDNFFTYKTIRENAIIVFTEIIETNPNDADAYFNRGVIYDWLQDYTKAESDFSKLIQIKPKDAFAHYCLGELYRRSHEYSKALNSYTNAIEINRLFGPAYYGREYVYKEINLNNKSYKDFQMAKSLGVTAY
ncbi:MAG: tetratricopeptide repeat protein [Ignavibacteriae bacterium]|nr:tetratricopeptide repeat protein [Ignavibacteriota bacterium]